MHYLGQIKKVLSVLPMLFCPPVNISSGQMRLLGFLTWCSGLILLVILCSVMLLIEKLMLNYGVGALMMVLMLISYGLMSIGAYRLFSGKDEPWHMQESEVTFTALLKVLGSLIGAMIVAALIIVAILYLFSFLGISPSDWLR